VYRAMLSTGTSPQSENGCAQWGNFTSGAKGFC